MSNLEKLRSWIGSVIHAISGIIQDTSEYLGQGSTFYKMLSKDIPQLLGVSSIADGLDFAGNLWGPIKAIKETIDELKLRKDLSSIVEDSLEKEKVNLTEEQWYSVKLIIRWDQEVLRTVFNAPTTYDGFISWLTEKTKPKGRLDSKSAEFVSNVILENLGRRLMSDEGIQRLNLRDRMETLQSTLNEFIAELTKKAKEREKKLTEVGLVGILDYRYLIGEDSEDIPDLFRGLESGIPRMVDFDAGYVIYPRRPITKFLESLHLDFSTVGEDETTCHYEDAIITGPMGSGKTWTILSLGYLLIRKGWNVLYAKADVLVRHGLSSALLKYLFQTDEKTALIIDDAHIHPSHVNDITHQLRQHKSKTISPIRLVVAARASSYSNQATELQALFKTFDVQQLGEAISSGTIAQRFLEIARQKYDIHDSFNAEGLLKAGGNIALFCEAVRRISEESGGQSSSNFDPWSGFPEYVLKRRIRNLSNRSNAVRTLGIIAAYTRIELPVTREYIITLMGNGYNDTIDELIEQQQIWAASNNPAYIEVLGISHPAIANHIFHASRLALQEAGIIKAETHETDLYGGYFEYLDKMDHEVRGHENLRLLHAVSAHPEIIENNDCLDEFYEMTLKQEGHEIVLHTIFNFGVSFQKRDELDKAQLAYKEVLKRNDDYIRAMINLSSLHFKREEYEKAEKILRRVININDDELFAFTNLSAVYERTERHCLAEMAARVATEIDSTHPTGWNALALALLKKDKLDSALAAAAKAIKIDREFELPWVHSIRILNKMKKFNLALRKGEEALALHPKSYRIHMRKGVALMNLGHHEDAVTSIESALELNNDDPNLLFFHAEALRRNGELGRAKEVTTCLTDEHPNFGPGWKMLCGVLFDMNEDFSQAFERAKALDSVDDELLIIRGCSLIMGAQTSEVYSMIENIREHSEDFVEVGGKIGRILYDREKVSLAKKVLLSAANINGKAFLPNYILGRIALDKDDDNAMQYFQIAEQTRPASLDTKYWLGRALLEKDMIDDAIEYLWCVVNRDENRLGAWFYLFHAYMLKGKQSRRALKCALFISKKTTSLHPKNAFVWGNRGAVEFRLARLDEAKRSLLKSIGLKKDFPLAWFNLGNVWFDKENYSQAESCFRRGLKLDPDNSPARMDLAKILRKRGKHEEALEQETIANTKWARRLEDDEKSKRKYNWTYYDDNIL